MKTRFHAALLLTVFLALWGIDAFAQHYPWTKHPANPVLRGDSSSSWRKGVFGTCVLYNSDSSRFEMWFSGSQTAGGSRPCKIGFAVSSDGVSWKVRPDPVLAPGTGKWDSASVEVPYVIREKGEYKMWYSGAAEAYHNRIGYATSADGINWTKSGQMVLGPGDSTWEAGGVGACCVIHDSGGYRMWYTGFTTSILNGPMYIGCATSTDGLSWQRDTLHGPVLAPGTPGSWDSRWIAAPRVLFLSEKYYMWYTGCSSSGNYQVGLASSPDGVSNWTKAPGNPVLRNSQSGWDSSDVECGTILAGGTTLYMWYDGSPRPFQWRVGLATSPILDIVEEPALPTVCELGQNYPNPFNPNTTIKYELPNSSVVRLNVYDMLGREVSVLVNEKREAGVHEVRFDASGLASGVYVYRLQAGDLVRSRKLLVLR